ncbi:hypothetical protein G9A89_005942 [Geosiphon pyriformis]|nr:hypothetical protein G9A89_005942 [Geosiphon pyriformis]
MCYIFKEEPISKNKWKSELKLNPNSNSANNSNNSNSTNNSNDSNSTDDNNNSNSTDNNNSNSTDNNNDSNSANDNNNSNSANDNNNSNFALNTKQYITLLNLTIKQELTKFSNNNEGIINNKFKVATTPDTATLEYYQSIYTHCKQRFNIPDGIEIVKKSVYQYIENCINNYLFGNYNISEGTEDLNSETLATYFQELNFNIIKYCEEKYPVQSKYSFDFESETETSNKGKQRLKQYSRTTSNTPTLQKTTAKHLQTPEQGTNIKLPLSITPFPISLVQPQTLSSPLSRFSRPEDFQSHRNPIQQQEPILTSANIIDYLQKNESNHSESLESKETKSEPEEIPENKEEMATAYIAKIPEFTGEDNNTSSQKWLDKVQKARDANGTAGEWFENLEEPFENWQAFKDAFLQQFTNNNTFITLRNPGLKDKLIKKVRSHAPADLATAIKHAKSYEMAIEEANHTKLVNLAIGETSLAAEKKIDQLTKKVESYFTNQQQQQQQPQRYQPPQ